MFAGTSSGRSATTTTFFFTAGFSLSTKKNHKRLTLVLIFNIVVKWKIKITINSLFTSHSQLFTIDYIQIVLTYSYCFSSFIHFHHQFNMNLFPKEFSKSRRASTPFFLKQHLMTITIPFEFHVPP
jgi:hypothetical protein